MNEDDNFERTVARSLRQRTRAVGESIPDLDAVWDHVDRRRRRRRHVAAVGSAAVVAVGALGIATLGGSGPDRIPAPAAATPDQQAAWRCTDQLDHFESGSRAVFFATCESVMIDGSAILGPPTPTTPSDGTVVAVPMTTLPGADVATTAPVQEITYLVRAGDTLTSIAAAFGMSIDEIVAVNQWGGRSEVTLVEGETIVIALSPVPTVPMTSMATPTTTTSLVRSVPVGRSAAEQQHVVADNDSVTSIATAYDVTVEQLANYNDWPDGVGHLLLIGDTILIPPGAAIAPTTTSVP